jgi:protein TonB
MSENQPPAKPAIGANDRLGFTLFLATAVHLIIVLGVGFTQSDASQKPALPGLDIIVANSKSVEQPDDPDFLALENQKGGGEQNDKSRPSATFSAPTPLDHDGMSDRAQPLKRSSKVQIENIFYLTQHQAQREIDQAKRRERNSPQRNGSDEVEIKLQQIASLQAEIRKMTQRYAKRPREIALTASTRKAVEAGYLAQWVNKIEHIGNLNYPAEAEVNKIDGSLRMNVRLNAAGEVIDVHISKSSGHSLLDEAARRIVRLAQPFAPFPEELKRRADQIVIVRTWQFESNTLSTSGNS